MSREQHLVAFLQEHDEPCPRCGHMLHRIAQARCPECGLPVALTVQPAHPINRIWVATVIVLAALSGFGLLMAIVMIVEGLPGAMIFHLVAWTSWTAVPLLVAAIVFRRWFLQRRPLWQAIMLAAAGILAAITIILFCLGLLL